MTRKSGKKSARPSRFQFPEDLREPYASQARAQLNAGHKCNPIESLKVADSRPLKTVKKRKQAGRDETQCERDVLDMLQAAWPSIAIESQYKMSLAEDTDYTIDFRFKPGGEDVRVEAKGGFTREDSRVKFKCASSLLRWVFFVWCKQHRKTKTRPARWTFEVWHAGKRLQFKRSKAKNPVDIYECRQLIEAHIEGLERLCNLE